LYGIAIKNGTTVKAIKELNGLTSDVIKIGQKLQLQ
jgi:LysM repeat protein